MKIIWEYGNLLVKIHEIPIGTHYAHDRVRCKRMAHIEPKALGTYALVGKLHSTCARVRTREQTLFSCWHAERSATLRELQPERHDARRCWKAAIA